MITFKNTIAALEAFDASQPERSERWRNIKSDVDVEAADAADKEAAEKVRIAFHEDTKSVNSMEHVRTCSINDIRVLAELNPLVESIAIGNVSFGKLTGELWPDGTPKWTFLSIMGDERVRLLTDARNGWALPEGIILVGHIAGGYHPIPEESIAWRTSGIPVRGA